MYILQIRTLHKPKRIDVSLWHDKYASRVEILKNEMLPQKQEPVYTAEKWHPLCE